MPQFNSYIKSLRSKYKGDELTSYRGNNQIRYEAFSPIFKNLYENKIVYSEESIGIIKVENIIITPEHFQATAISYLVIKRGNRYDEMFLKGKDWGFGSTWEGMHLGNNNTIGVAYAGWTIWCDPELVKEVEELIQNEKMDEALLLTINYDREDREALKREIFGDNI